MKKYWSVILKMIIIGYLLMSILFSVSFPLINSMYCLSPLTQTDSYVSCPSNAIFLYTILEPNFFNRYRHCAAGTAQTSIRSIRIRKSLCLRWIFSVMGFRKGNIDISGKWQQFYYGMSYYKFKLGKKPVSKTKQSNP